MAPYGGNTFMRIVLATLLLAGPYLSAADATVPTNTWTQVSDEKENCKFACSTWNLPATDEFMLWGASGQPNCFPKKYDVECFDLHSGTWHDSFPKGKEQSWSNG